MDHACHQILPGAGFALEQNRRESTSRRRARDEVANLRAKGVHHRRLADELAKPIHAPIIKPRLVVG
jgi:hypothetical protein